MKLSLPPLLAPALKVQLLHLALAILWNIAGVILVSLGHAALGPVASLTLAGIMLIMGVLLVLTAHHSRWLYLGLSVFIILSLLNTISTALLSELLLWPNDFWRYAGALINSLGVVGALWGIYLMFSSLNKS